MVSKLAETFYQFRLLPISKTGRDLSANSRTLLIVPKIYRSLGSGVKYRLGTSAGRGHLRKLDMSLARYL